MTITMLNKLLSSSFLLIYGTLTGSTTQDSSEPEHKKQ